MKTINVLHHCVLYICHILIPALTANYLTENRDENSLQSIFEDSLKIDTMPTTHENQSNFQHCQQIMPPKILQGIKKACMLAPYVGH